MSCSSVLLLLLLLVSCAGSGTTPDHRQTGDRPAADSVQKAVVSLLHWYEGTYVSYWEPEFVLAADGQPYQGDEEECPCRIDPKAVDQYAAWMAANAPPVSSRYVAGYRDTLRQIQRQLDSPQAYPDQSAVIESVYTKGFNLMPGQDYPDFEKAGFYNDSARWEITFPEESTAVANVTYRWGGTLYAYRFDMVREGGAWKLGRPVEEGVVDEKWMKR